MAIWWFGGFAVSRIYWRYKMKDMTPLFWDLKYRNIIGIDKELEQRMNKLMHPSLRFQIYDKVESVLADLLYENLDEQLRKQQMERLNDKTL
jgi:hypothetical protein